MLSRLAFVVTVALFLTAWSGPFVSAQEAKKSPAPAELKSLITEATKLLTDKDYEKLLERIVEPALKAKFKEEKMWEDVVKRFGEGHAEKLLKILKTLPEAEPKLNEEKTEATYDLAKELEAPRSMITFVKVKDVWYLQN